MTEEHEEPAAVSAREGSAVRTADEPDRGPMRPAAREPGATDFSDGRRRRLDPRHVAAARTVGWISTAFLAVGAGAGFLALVLASSWPGWALGLAGGGSLLVLILLAGLAHLWPPIDYRRVSWRLDGDGIEIKRGVVWRHVVNVPRARIQHTDVTQGPVQRRYGLATLVIHTAGTHEYEVSLEGLSHPTALAVRDELLADPVEER